jgi:hypothetical protein
MPSRIWDISHDRGSCRGSKQVQRATVSEFGMIWDHFLSHALTVPLNGKDLKSELARVNEVI